MAAHFPATFISLSKKFVPFIISKIYAFEKSSNPADAEHGCHIVLSVWRSGIILLFGMLSAKKAKQQSAFANCRFFCKEVTKKMQVILGDYAHSLGLMFILLDFFQKS
jgi:hypothetical protein